MTDISEAIVQVEAAINVHERLGNGPFSVGVLRNALNELNRMESSAEFEPSYPRFLLDWEDSSGALGTLLSELAYHRQRAIKRRQ